ncbi:hypothetical protein ON073_16605, partial [Pseudoalteromonas sp. G4]|nr:hypothetical protein [Pseudoalteromonas sp. G4]
DGIGNNADTDDDNDGVPDNEDAFPLDNTESVDTDNDGIGNNADTDDDNDGVPDTEDAFPLDNTESVDTDSDGIGNNADTDDDNDGVLDNDDAFPLDPSETDDFDLDGIGDNADNDDDNDLFTDNEDFLHAVAHHPSSTIYESSNIIFKARGFYTDETKLSASDNWHIQYQIFDRALNKEVPFYSDNGYYNAQFDFQKLNWVIDIPAPDYSGEFYINLTLYCSSGSNICGDKDLSENFFQVQQKVPFTVECTKTPCGYNPGSAQGINISKSQSKNYIKDATSSDNGNLLAFYSSDQTPNASYVSLSEDAGNSWSIVGTFPENSINGVFLDETRLIFTCDSAFCMAHSNNSKDWSKVNLYNDSDFLINHKNISNYSLKLNGFVHKLESAYSVFFTDHSSNKSISYVTRTTDFVNWSSPQELVNEQEDFDFYTYKIIQANDQGYFGLFTSQLDYSLKLMQSEDGVTWSVINSFDFVVAGDLLFENNKLSLYFQYYGERGIYQIVSYDLLNFTPMKKVIDDVDTGVEVLPLSSNEHGILFNQEHDYINDVYFKKVDH